MPELPEVETVCRGLAPRLTGRSIAKVTLRRKDIRIPIPTDFATKACGGIIESVARRAKYILMPLTNRQTILLHLGMSGRVLLHEGIPNRWHTHDHAIFHLDDGAVMVFNDPRRFGVLTIASTTDMANHPLLAHLGWEPLLPEFTAKELKSALKSRKSAIKVAIMDQELVVGVGNIYASEALFRAGILPVTPAHSLTLRQCEALVKNIQEVLAEAIESGGSTLRDYVRSSGELGYFQHHFSVYGKEGVPCVICSTPIAKLALGGRSTYFCATCQR